MKLKLYTLFAASLIMGAMACKKDPEPAPANNNNNTNTNNNNNNNNGCDTVGMTFSTNVQPIINTNCISCHSGASAPLGIKLDSYAGVQSNIAAIIPAINHSPSLPQTKWMPQNLPKLDSCDIQTIEAWRNQGMPQ